MDGLEKHNQEWLTLFFSCTSIQAYVHDLCAFPLLKTCAFEILPLCLLIFTTWWWVHWRSSPLRGTACAAAAWPAQPRHCEARCCRAPRRGCPPLGQRPSRPCRAAPPAAGAPCWSDPAGASAGHLHSESLSMVVVGARVERTTENTCVTWWWMIAGEFIWVGVNGHNWQ